MKLPLSFSILITYLAVSAGSVYTQDLLLFQTRQDYYTTEDRTEVMLQFPTLPEGDTVRLYLGLDSRNILQKDTVLNDQLLLLPVSLKGLSEGSHELVLWMEYKGVSRELKSALVKLAPKPNAVKIDRFRGSLIVHDMPFFPFGYYCYSPVQSTLAEEEVVKGFNLMSPYQRIQPNTREERIDYMDRCAQLGMQVHYQLISISGGGGVGSSQTGTLTTGQKLEMLKEEVMAIKDHPALLAWYLSDEPTGHGADPDSLKVYYDKIKELDPYHPVSIVFMAPHRALDYAAAMDLVMADPYPIPNSGVVGVGAITEQLKDNFRYRKPVWIVPQAFGGGEHWSREPSPDELRVMTYLALVRGATGIQYFVRHGLNGFPKSSVTWSEAARVAMEVTAVTPYLLDGDLIPEITGEKQGVWFGAWRLGDRVILMVVNSTNQPRNFSLEMPEELKKETGRVLFRQRELTLVEGILIDWIGAYGTQVYQFGTIGNVQDPANMLVDPGFENWSSYGVPAACYARVGSDRGATGFLDARLAIDGEQSLRLTTPVEGKGLGFSFFPVQLNSGQSYRFVVFAKGDTASWIQPEPLSFWQRLFKKPKVPKRTFKIKIGEYAEQEVRLSPNWEPTLIYFKIPELGDDQARVNVYLELIGQGIAWFDAMELLPDPVIGSVVSEENKRIEVTMVSASPGAQLRYNLEGRKPTTQDALFQNSFPIDQPTVVVAGLFDGGDLLTWSARSFEIHLGMGRQPVYEHPFNSRYSAGGKVGLVDGIRGSRNYLDGRWQGFNGQDMAVTFDFDDTVAVSSVSVGCLQVIASWIFMPLNLIVEGSVDGLEYHSMGKRDNTIDEHTTGSIRRDFTVSFPSENVRFLRVRATNRNLCPDWHNGKGKAAFIFVDEVVVK